MSATAGLWMLAAVGIVLIATGLPAWTVLLGVAAAFAAAGVALDVFTLPILTAAPARVLGLLENDLLQALPLYVLMGALLHHLPLADILFRMTSRLLRRTGAGPALAGLGLGALLAPMNGAVGSSVATLARTVSPRLAAAGIAPERNAAIVAVASTLGVVVPPSLVLILLSDAMMRAHTEAVNATGIAARIVNTQDVFVGALLPAAVLLLLHVLLTLRTGRTRRSAPVDVEPSATRGEAVVAGMTFAIVGGLLAAVTMGYLYAVEAAATGGVLLLAFGALSRTLTARVLRDVLRDTLAVTGALFALLVGATVFTLVLRAYGTDRWVAAALVALPGGAPATLAVVLATVAACALVLDALEMIFVVIPVVMPALLAQVGDAAWVAVLTLLILQASFLAPPFGYAVLMVRNVLREPLATGPLSRALLPYLGAQLAVVALTLAWPGIVWHRDEPPGALAPAAAPSGDDARKMLELQLDQNGAPAAQGDGGDAADRGAGAR